MNFEKTPLKGSYIIEPVKEIDKRGFFLRTFDKIEFLKMGDHFTIVQTNISFNKKVGTLRGMHYQIHYKERKIVQCIKGSIYDVILDIRPESETYKQWFGVELNDNNNKLLFIPDGFAHGFITLKGNSIVLYYMDQYYHEECAKRISYKSCNIDWKTNPTVISEKDLKAEIYE